MERFFYIHYINQFKLIIMKKFILIALFGLMVSCSNVQHPDYSANVELTKQWIEVYETQNLDLLTQITSTQVDADRKSVV